MLEEEEEEEEEQVGVEVVQEFPIEKSASNHLQICSSCPPSPYLRPPLLNCFTDPHALGLKNIEHCHFY